MRDCFKYLMKLFKMVSSVLDICGNDMVVTTYISCFIIL